MMQAINNNTIEKYINEYIYTQMSTNKIPWSPRQHAHTQESTHMNTYNVYISEHRIHKILIGRVNPTSM